MTIPIVFAVLGTAVISIAATYFVTVRLLRSGQMADLERQAIAAELSSGIAAKERLLDALKKQLIDVAGHELRTPITLIIGYIDLIRAGHFGDISDALYEPLETMDNNAKRINFLARRMVILLRRRAEIKPVPICDVLQQVVKSKEVYIATRRRPDEVTFNVDCVGIVAEVDEEAVSVALFEVIHNAIKFEAKTLSIQVINGNDLRISVADDGIGIAKKDHRRIFSPGEQVDSSNRRRYEGMGMGLHYVSEIVRWHDGYIDLESELGQGSTFTLVLPLNNQKRQIKDIKKMSEKVKDL